MRKRRTHNVRKKKTGSKRKIKRSDKKKKIFEESVAALIKKSKERGFVTYSEILTIYPRIEDDLLSLEELYDKLGDAGIDVLEARELIEDASLPPKKQSLR